MCYNEKVLVGLALEPAKDYPKLEIKHFFVCIALRFENNVSHLCTHAEFEALFLRVKPILIKIHWLANSWRKNRLKLLINTLVIFNIILHYGAKVTQKYSKMLA